MTDKQKLEQLFSEQEYLVLAVTLDDGTAWPVPVRMRTGDGKTDDTAALSLAFDVAAKLGQNVFLPTGSYIVTDFVVVCLPAAFPFSPSFCSFVGLSSKFLLNLLPDPRWFRSGWFLLVADRGIWQGKSSSPTCSLYSSVLQAFQDELSPRPMIRVGHEGDVGSVEISDLLFTARGPTLALIGVEWNIKGDHPGSAAMWGALTPNCIKSRL